MKFLKLTEIIGDNLIPVWINPTHIVMINERVLGGSALHCNNHGFTEVEESPFEIVRMLEDIKC